MRAYAGVHAASGQASAQGRGGHPDTQGGHADSGHTIVSGLLFVNREYALAYFSIPSNLSELYASQSPSSSMSSSYFLRRKNFGIESHFRVGKTLRAQRSGSQPVFKPGG